MISGHLKKAVYLSRTMVRMYGSGISKSKVYSMLLGKIRWVSLLLFSLFMVMAPSVHSQKKSIDQRVDSLLRLMTLDEKVGQMNQYSGMWEHTGPITEENNLLGQIKEGKVGSMLNINGVAHTRQLQE